MAAPLRQKDQIYWKILNAAVALDIRKGHLKWSMSELSRAARVTRPLIYYYFGKSKLGILQEAVALFGAEFSGATPKRQEDWRQGRIAETLLDSRRILKASPELLPFYLLNRARGNALSRELKAREKVFRGKISEYFPHLPEAEADAACAAVWGLVFTPELPEAAMHAAVRLLFRK
jgi:AcrR family transcriptional regulator